MPEDGAYCPYFHQAIEMIGRRWTGAILLSMTGGCTTFSQIRDAIPGISDRLLSERLKELESEGVVERRVHGRSTAYGLTEKGQALQPVLEAVSAYAHVWAAG